MDPFSDMLGGIRAERAAVNRAALEPAWKIRFGDGAPLTMLTIVSGRGRLVLHDGAEFEVAAGDTAIILGPEPFHLADLDATADSVGRTYLVSCFDQEADREPKQDANGSTTLVVGAYRGLKPRHERLLKALPPVIVLNEAVEDVVWLQALDEALARRSRPGGRALVDRVLDWGLICTLSCWFDIQGAKAPAWYLGALDPVAGPALEAVHRRPGERWTVGALAAVAGVSRAHFAKRFTEVMGQPPLAYLTEWRMCLAEDLLADPDRAVAEVAREVGYADPFAFSTAFKRLHGASPSAYRSKIP
ncbi:AraC family transcriptional regulator [Glycomyces harbinensis]|uniref:AraC-type DNA-binding protein n=1 Tax=Glycomyces harbinensis TaxID=58114 RepID=A0A1G7AHE4_9ACTN|nr:AraC family transcriptional regulator [Glycomyces harbinensis]SDE13475.1 AraC-type DNA-binding protein [Glycomyces harbinensis]